jgi:hypothetical protein
MFQRNPRHLFRAPVTLTLFLALFAALLCVTPAVSKDKPLLAVMPYEAPDGPAYVEVADLMLNGKTKVLQCVAGAPIDNNSYKKFAKLKLAQATIIERSADGTLEMKTASGSACIVPSGLKLEKNARLTTSQMADQAVVQGRLVGRSSNAAETIPLLKPGVKLQFIEAPDTELAEYLRAARWQTIELWRGYLRGFASAAHGNEARQSLTATAPPARNLFRFVAKAGSCAVDSDCGCCRTGSGTTTERQFFRASRISSQLWKR